jgi:hypothetical protein
MWNMISSFAIGIIIAVLIARTVIREQLEFRRNRKRLEARAIIADQAGH